jgi:hypothetical protein
MAWTHRETFGQGLDTGTVDADPSAGAGLAAPVGSKALFGGTTYQKTGAGDTDWRLFEAKNKLVWAMPTISPTAIGLSYVGTNLNTATQRQIASLTVPSDFGALVAAAMVCKMTVGKVAANIDLDVTFGGDGEPYNQHSAADATSTYDFTANQWHYIDLSALLVDLAAGDSMGLRVFNQSGSTLQILGIYIEYSSA